MLAIFLDPANFFATLTDTWAPGPLPVFGSVRLSVVAPGRGDSENPFVDSGACAGSDASTLIADANLWVTLGEIPEIAGSGAVRGGDFTTAA